MDALEHLQSAVLEIIAAAKSALDAAEQLVRDPSPLLSVVQKPNPSSPEDPPPRVEHIPVE